MSQQMPTPNSEDERADLLATLAAARELGPEMDTSLVESYMRRRGTERDRGDRGRRAAAPGQSGWPALAGNPRLLWYACLGLLGVLLLVGTIASFFWAPATGATATTGASGAHWGFPYWLGWLFFPWLFFVFFGRRGLYRSRRHYSYETEDGRRVYVTERSRGYWPDDPDGRGPGGSSGQARDPRDPYAPPPPDQRPPASRSGYGADYHTDYRTEYRSDERRDTRTD